MASIEQRADVVRDFNRFYTRRIGVLGHSHLGSPFSLTDVRVLYELAHRERPTASEIGDALGLDRGYLSRTLRVFKKRGLITTRASATDGRQVLLELTAAGRKSFAPLEAKARDTVVDLLRPLGADEQRRILAAMRTIRDALDTSSSRAESAPYQLRSHRPGDMGWVVHRHGVLYHEEYGWDERFEALVARVVAGFIEKFDPAFEHCWIAERNGDIVGSVFVVKKSKTVAKLRLLYVEPSARGLGIGGRLVDEVIAFARKIGYKRITLWTQSDLTSARKIYKSRGFAMTGTEGHDMFGSTSIAETWELVL